jgi:hypothetical protein
LTYSYTLTHYLSHISLLRCCCWWWWW